MVAHIINIVGLFLAVLLAGEDAADVGLALGAGAKAGGVRQQSLEELDGTISCPLKLTGVVDSMPTSSRQRMWSR